MVEVEGTWIPSRARCQAMVSGPASAPSATRVWRSAMIRARTASVVVCGRDLGALDCARHHRRDPTGLIALHELMDPLTGDPELGRSLGDGQALIDH